MSDPTHKSRLRKALLTARKTLPDRDRRDALIGQRLAALLRAWQPACVGLYWPIQDEFDARPAIAAWLAGGCSDAEAPAAARRAALPVVDQPASPLVFHLWQPDTPMVEGHYRIPVPDGTPVVTPDLLLVPCVGFTRAGFRLGYGGGFYDRTLGALAPRPRTVGLAFDVLESPALAVEPHDLPLDLILTESAVHGPAAACLPPSFSVPS
ncbi:5-formyltetrahydrofolate cyclo-ligase [Pandoraea terrae]|uniref:5-formyltetrahydrofolate cyclo-ligase n=1 Tax=Pandoraea terrae TaxID=1537710 RepID=A0A5E4UWK7_9BURK|nr:5-formyltetrahydrofolate cyclo-ligase [Pandoraea terrae]VVE04337.1 5-formyltetrahydrofolate cyclo-ligase [Pandoraea terrae]